MPSLGPLALPLLVSISSRNRTCALVQRAGGALRCLDIPKISPEPKLPRKIVPYDDLTDVGKEVMQRGHRRLWLGRYRRAPNWGSWWAHTDSEYSSGSDATMATSDTELRYSSPEATSPRK